MDDWLRISPESRRLLRRYGFLLLPILPFAAPFAIEYLGAVFVPLKIVDCCEVPRGAALDVLPATYMVRTYSWISMFVLMGLISFAGAVYGSIVIFKRDAPTRDAALALVLVLIGILLYVTHRRWGTFQTDALIPLFQATVGALSGLKQSLSDDIKLALSWLTLVWGIPACILIAAAGSCVSWPGLPSPATANAATERSQELRIILYIAAAILVSGVISTRFLLEMPVAFYGQDVPPSVEKFVEAVQLQLSSIFTLILVTAYLPPAYLLSIEPRRVPGEQPQPAQQGGPANGGSALAIGTHIFPHLLRVFAIIAPLLANPFAGLIQAVVTTS